MTATRIIALSALLAGQLGCVGLAEEMKEEAAQASRADQADQADQGAQTKTKQAQVAKTANETQDAMAIAQQAADLCFGESPDYQAAHFAYRRARGLEPRNAYILVAEATCYVRQGAEQKFDKPDGTATDDPDELDLAKKWLKRGKVLADQALQVNPEYGTAHFVIAETYALAGDTQKALDKLNFIEQNRLIPWGHASTFYAWRGYVKTTAGNDFDAKVDYDRAVELAEPFEQAEYADGVLHARDNKRRGVLGGGGNQTPPKAVVFAF